MHMHKDYAFTAGSEVRSLSLSPSSATYWLWGLGQTAFFFWPSLFPFVYWGRRKYLFLVLRINCHKEWKMPSTSPGTWRVLHKWEPVIGVS